ncbi:MAG: 2-isopropylmalate synthase [Candidatus Methanoperedens sp.]|nr:2-isopropylmalate synthase [Candidatus Methanoperedens sp.]PKL53821.1 MAG: 2-isopropylmalate synthase [Candidatus Methanoperedenaceae archaeon HGW-Methanoperedenaceae-1]
MKDIKILDTTLRDGEQTPGVSLTLENKLLIARKLDILGVDIIEAGSAITSEGERASIKKIAAEGLNAEICSYCRVRKEDIDSALACDVDSIHLVVPVSDLHIQQKLKKDRETVRRMAVDMTEYAKSHGLIVELSGEDASRADMDYLKSVYKAGIDAGADRLCLCDTVGILTPERSYDIFSDMAKLPAPLSVHCHNDFGMATANTMAALRAGATQAHVTINGIGERAGNTSLEEVVMVLELLYKHKTKFDTKGLYPLSRLVSRLSGVPVAPNKAIVGGNAFTHEAGIHVHGLLANTATYEPITPELVGRERRIVMGKHAGRSSVVLALKELGLDVTEPQINDIIARVKELGDKGKHVTDADLQAIAETVLGVYQEAKVKLEELTVVSGNTVMPTASIRLNVNGVHVVEAGVGTGPVDAAITALKKGISGIADIQLDEYHVDAITGGTDALVEVWVKLSKGGKTITARGARTDIIMASVEAVLEGINRLIQQDRKDS